MPVVRLMSRNMKADVKNLKNNAGSDYSRVKNTLMTKNYLLRIRLTRIFHLMTISGQINAEVNGEQLYIQNCMVCHADDGSGAMPGVSDLTKNRSWSTIPESQLVARLKQGIQSPGAAISMPLNGGNPDLTDRDLLVIIFYMREEFLN
jgi:cytochrome c5